MDKRIRQAFLAATVLGGGWLAYAEEYPSTIRSNAQGLDSRIARMEAELQELRATAAGQDARKNGAGAAPSARIVSQQLPTARSNERSVESRFNYTEVDSWKPVPKRTQATTQSPPTSSANVVETRRPRSRDVAPPASMQSVSPVVMPVAHETSFEGAAHEEPKAGWTESRNGAARRSQGTRLILKNSNPIPLPPGTLNPPKVAAVPAPQETPRVPPATVPPTTPPSPHVDANRAVKIAIPETPREMTRMERLEMELRQLRHQKTTSAPTPSVPEREAVIELEPEAEPQDIPDVAAKEEPTELVAPVPDVPQQSPTNESDPSELQGDAPMSADPVDTPSTLPNQSRMEPRIAQEPDNVVEVVVRTPAVEKKSDTQEGVARPAIPPVRQSKFSGFGRPQKPVANERDPQSGQVDLSTRKPASTLESSDKSLPNIESEIRILRASNERSAQKSPPSSQATDELRADAPPPPAPERNPVASAPVDAPPAARSATNSTRPIVTGRCGPACRPAQKRGPSNWYTPGMPTLFEDRCWTAYAGFDLMFVQPSFENTDALRTQTGAGTAFTTDFDYNFEATPRIVGGLVFEDGFGARAQFWQFDHAVSAASGPSVGTLAISAPGVLPIMSSLVTDAAGQSLTAEHSLQLDVFDLEGTRQLRVGATAVTLGGGVRYLHMEQRYDVQKLDAAGTLLGSLSHDHDFEGFGPTFAAEWFTPLGDSGLAFYASGRGSVVFGTRDQTATRLDPASGIPIVREDRLDQNAQVAVGEAGIGLQYALDSLIFRVGYEAQIWTDVGSATSASGNMGLQGIAASIGYSY